MSFEVGLTIALISIPCILSYLVVNFKDDLAELLPLRVLFFGITMFCLILITQFGVIMAEDNNASADLIKLMTTPLYILVPLGVISVGYIVVILLIVAIKAWQNHKVDKSRSIFHKGGD